MGGHHYNKPGIKTGKRPFPDDFASLGADLCVNQIALHWRCDRATARKWIDAQSSEWRAARSEVMRERMRTAARRVQALGVEALRRMGEARRAAMPPKLPRATPDDFETLAADRKYNDLQFHYRASPATLSRWLNSMPQEWRETRSAVIEARAMAGRIAFQQKRSAEATALREARAAERKVIQDRLLAERAAARAEAAALKAEAAALMALAEPKTPHERVRAAGRTGPAKFRMKPMSMIMTAAPVGMAPMAANFLRRRIPQVYNARKVQTGGDYGDTWIVGTRTMTTAAMIEFARAEGWNPDGWRTVMPAAGEGAQA